MNLSEHFTLEEATFSNTGTRKGIKNKPDLKSLENMKIAAIELEKIRELTGPLHVNSWYRNAELNVAIGGSKTSAHMNGWAIDVTSSKFTPYELCKMVLDSDMEFDQIIHEYGSWMHISFDPMKRRQVLSIFESGKYKCGLVKK